MKLSQNINKRWRFLIFTCIVSMSHDRIDFDYMICVRQANNVE